MYRDFDRIVGDARRWLRTSRAHPSLSNEVDNFGWVRRARTVLDDPVEIVQAVESKRFLNGAHCVGALVVTASEDGKMPSGFLKWDQNGQIYVNCELTYYPHQLLSLNILTGVIIDRIYERFSLPMQSIMQQLNS